MNFKKEIKKWMTGSIVINRIVIVLGNKRHKRNKGNSW